MDEKAFIIGNAPSPLIRQQAPPEVAQQATIQIPISIPPSQPAPIFGQATQSVFGQPALTPAGMLSRGGVGQSPLQMMQQSSSQSQLQQMQSRSIMTMPINNVPLPGATSPARGMGIRGIATGFIPGAKQVGSN